MIPACFMLEYIELLLNWCWSGIVCEKMNPMTAPKRVMFLENWSSSRK